MKINKSDLRSIIEKIILEDVFSLDPNDNNLQQKIQKIKNDSTLFNSSEDEITLDGTNKQATESVYSKSDVLNMMLENKKNKIGGQEDYMKAVKKADRDLDYELNGPGWKAKDKTHKSKKQYDRKQNKKDYLNDNVNETKYSKKDIDKMIIEKKYNAIVYTKSELINELNNK